MQTISTPHPLALQDCWAKTDAAGKPTLSVLDHCRHVGAVAAMLTHALPPVLRRLLPDGSVTLCSLHDIGKISPGFLLKSPVWRQKWQNQLRLTAEGHETRHAWISQKVLAGQYKCPPRWLMALGGHHGRYLCNEARPFADFFQKSLGTGVFERLRGEAMSALTAEFGELPPRQDIEKGARLHWFTGFMIFCDWLGSNTTWFPIGQGTADLAKGAQRALDETGLHRREAAKDLKFQDFFGFSSPRPLQEALVAAMDAPGLYVVEAPMGDGKTEAALAGAYRRWTEGDERGLYFALPTQLTSNRIHSRVLDFLKRTVSDQSAFALVHGNAWLTECRMSALTPSSPATSPNDEPGNAIAANQWFSDSRRAMLAPFGVGTIDQALMAVVAAKFSALRMFGLGGKVVVIDEVHSYDDYTSALVDRLVEWLLELGGSVVILSATLTTARRAALVKAAGATELTQTSAYPLVTVVKSGAAEAVHLAVDPDTSRSADVAVEMCAAESASWMVEAVSAAESGACVLVVRNTVDLARETFKAFKGRCRDSGIRFGLVHSRFTQADRTRNEEHWMTALGKDDTRRPTSGAILVGTQVVEQSVDIDADLLMTDLAPTDLLLQRMGRLHRHPRSRPRGFEQARCLILCPAVDWEEDQPAIEHALAPHRFIYPPFALHMADRIWRKKSSVHLPEDIRTLIEDSCLIPDGLPDGVRALREAQEKKIAEMLAGADAGAVFKTVTVGDTEGFSTRWNIQPSAHMAVLAAKPCQQGSTVSLTFPCGTICGLHVGEFSFALARLLHLHAIRVPGYLVRDMLMAGDRPAWLAQHMPDGVLGILDEFGALAPWPSLDSAFSFHYHPDTGLAHSRNETAALNNYDDDESWF